MNRVPLITITTIFLATLLFCFSYLFIQNCSASENAPEIVFTKSSQTLGNIMSFGVAIADVDLDGDNDVFMSNYIGNGAGQLWINNGKGNFTKSSQNFGTGSPSTHDADMADLNGDSYPDIIAVNHYWTNQVFFNNGHGSFIESSQIIGTINDKPQTVQLVDVDGDNDNDAYISNNYAGNRIWLNDSNGFFTMRDVDYGGNDSNKQFLADFNNDTYPDIYISLRSAVPQIWMNDGAGNLVYSGQTINDSGDSVDSQDVDGDGDNDLVIGNYSQVTVWLYQNNTGSFIAGCTLGEGATRCKLFDADLDGDYDLVTGHIENGNKLWLNDGTGQLTYYSTLFPGIRILGIDCADLDGDNDLDIVLGQEQDSGGNSIYFNVTVPTNVDDNKLSEPVQFNLANNYPNPFNPRTRINYAIPQSGFVSLIVYDITGREITRLVNNNMPAGDFQVEFDGSNLANGVYVYQLTTGNQTLTGKMLLLK